jgi:energy-coupling factor transporter ATP-binding protein EcfA2
MDDEGLSTWTSMMNVQSIEHANKTLGVTFVVIEHTTDVLMNLNHRVVVLYQAEGHAMLRNPFYLKELAAQKWLLPPPDILLSQQDRSNCGGLITPRRYLPGNIKRRSLCLRFATLHRSN